MTAFRLRGRTFQPTAPISRQNYPQTTVQDRLAFLLTAILVAAIVTGVLWYHVNQIHMYRLRKDYQAEKQEFVREIIDLKAARLHSFVVENTYWDEAIAFLRTEDLQWAKINLDEPAQVAAASALWVYRRDSNLVHTWQSHEIKTEIPNSSDLLPALAKLDRLRMALWYVRVGSDIWEMHGATINSGKDPQHVGKYFGYMIAGRQCDQAYVSEISRVARCKLSLPEPIVRGTKVSSASAASHSRLKVDSDDMAWITVAIPLADIKGHPVSVLRGASENPLAPAINQATHQAILLFGVFVCSIFGLTLVILTRWLSAPIRLLSDALMHRDQERLAPLLTEQTEFGFLAHFIAAFFRQEHALLESQQELEGRVADRTAELTHRAYHDALTGLPNRSLFSGRLETALNRTKRSGSHLAVLFVDLDDFKVVNDSLGHEIGDGLLRAAARRMQQCMPADAVIARFGGDEFAILLEATTESETRLCAERLAMVLRDPFVVAGHTLCTTASIGVASGRKARSPGDVLRNADIAMYDAKGQVRSRDRAFYSEFDSRMLEKAEERLAMEAALRSALRDGGSEFHLVYQPIYDIQTKHIHGTEALMRWEHPTKGSIAPNDFIPLAEETGLIHELTEWVLKEACRFHKRLLRSLPFSSKPAFISVNFSPVALESEGMASHILDYLERQGLTPSHFAIEVTESVIARQSPTVLLVLSELRAAGVRVLMDDFGTGYSSLASLMDLPIDVIKIDRAFVGFLEERLETRAILRAIVALAEALRMEVICEGIERPEQSDILADMGNLLGQGFLFSPPIRAEELEETLQRKYLPGFPAASCPHLPFPPSYYQIR